MVGPALGQVPFDVIQTFSFMQKQRPRAKALAQWIHTHSPYKTVSAIPSPVGAAHAYDTVHLLALAVERARSTQGSRCARLPSKNCPLSPALCETTSPPSRRRATTLWTQPGPVRSRGRRRHTHPHPMNHPTPLHSVSLREQITDRLLRILGTYVLGFTGLIFLLTLASVSISTAANCSSTGR
ncbi:hypothetical protein GHT06_007535 [Daphnia sinensis]|uniref:Uncharacterized protein n=1 Tax=Daphnia sinensis TaxID=1820382 RepID=A0AAD5PNQ0_9CRUS|nr:hypothetical protein GHT06_007535 [Daphnia sinensis]